MYFANVVKKWNIRLSVIDLYEGERDFLIGQVWGYNSDPHSKPDDLDFFLFTPKRLQELEGVRFESDGRGNLQECLSWVKTHITQQIKRSGLFSDRIKTAFTIAPAEQVF